MTVRWHIVTPELPPECGGVGDYTAQVAQALRQQGDRVTVYVPQVASAAHEFRDAEVVPLGDRFGERSIRVLSAQLDADPDARLLIQYVPAVFGRRGANVPFCRWALSRRQKGTDVRVMFHEPYLYLRWRPDHIVVAFTQRAMAAILLDASLHLYFSTETWHRYLGGLRSAVVQRAITLPIPSAIPRVDAAQAVRATRTTMLGNATFLIGHFGTYGRHIAPALRRIFRDLFSSNDRVAVLCAGAGSDRFVADFLAAHPDLRGRVTASGRASADDISVQLQACDLLVQPYPDGVTTRRTSVMAGLVNGCPVVTTDGKLTEHVWHATGCVALAKAGDWAGVATLVRDLLADPGSRAVMRDRATATYDAHFSLRHTVDALRADCVPLPDRELITDPASAVQGQL